MVDPATLDAPSFPRIADHAMLSDCHTTALVAPDGTIEWLCVPRFDSPSIFGALLDRSAGRFRLGPRMTVPVARRYVPGTNVLEGEEGTFAICSFWLVAALSEIGEPEQARALCEKLLAFAGSLGLYGEEIEPRSGVHLGNFPQAFTHLALINAVSHVIADEQREDDGPTNTAVFTEMRRDH